MATKKKQLQPKKITNKELLKNEVTEERIIEPKNYLMVFAIFLITAFFVLLFRHWYISYENYQLTIPVLKDKITEVTVNELDTFLTENPDPIVYIEVSEDENSRSVANDLISLVKKRNLTDRVVYINLSNIENKDAFFSDFTAKYMNGNKLEYYPAMVIFSDGKVLAYVSKTENQALNIDDVEQMFDEFEIEGE